VVADSVPALAPVPGLDAVAEDPSCLERLPRPVLIELRRRAGHLLADLDAALAARVTYGGEPSGPEQVLSIAEAAERLQTTADSLYRKWRTLPFAYKDPLDGRLKFSARGIQAYLRTRLRR
jgi:hypothetical protein